MGFYVVVGSSQYQNTQILIVAQQLQNLNIACIHICLFKTRFWKKIFSVWHDEQHVINVAKGLGGDPMFLMLLEHAQNI